MTPSEERNTQASGRVALQSDGLRVASILFACTLPLCLGQSCGNPAVPLDPADDPDDEQVLPYQPELPPTTGGDDWELQIAAWPVEGPAPLSVMLSATTMSSDPLPEGVYYWYFGDDGTTVEGAEVNHVFRDAGTYAVTLCFAVAAGTGCSRTAERTITAYDATDSNPGITEPPTEPPATNAPPVADNGTQVLEPNTTVVLTLTGRDASGNDLMFFIVTDPQHGTLGPIDNTPHDTATVRYTPAAGYTGPDSFTFKAHNGVAESNIATMKLTILGPNGAPVANAGPDLVVHDVDHDGFEGVDLDASASADADGYIVNYRWTKGTVVLAQGPEPTARTALALGSHTLTLTVTDDRGATGTDTLNVIVNTPPVADAGPDQSVDDPEEDGVQTVTLQGSASYDPDGTIVNYRWSEGTTTLASGSSPNAVVSLLGGRHHITLTVTDNHGGTDTDTVVIDVATPFTVDAGPDQEIDSYNGQTLVAVPLTAAVDGKPGLQIVNYRWSIGETVIATGPDPTATAHLPSGVHTITLTATDSRGIAASDDAVVYVQQRLLKPGNGFTGPTPEPAPVGYDLNLPEDQRPAGWDAKAIARWDVVPYQTFDGDFNVGVVAFHMNGIDRVEFSVNGGPWLPVYRMTRNVQTANHSDIGVQTDGIVEYWATLRAADFADGPVEIRAIAWPTVGLPRLLAGSDLKVDNGEHSMLLYANAGGSFVEPDPVYVSLNGSDDNDGTRERPFATLTKAFFVVPDGGTIILLEAGDHPAPYRPYGHWNRPMTRWVTVRPDEGLEGDVTIVPSSESRRVQPAVGLVRWQDVAFDWGTLDVYYGYGSAWFDRVRWDDSLGWEHQRGEAVHYQTPYYVTGSVAYNASYGFVRSRLVRNSHVERISGDAYQQSRFVVNSTARNVDGRVTDQHTDLYQMWGQADNLIIYGLTATELYATQAIFLEPSLEHRAETESLSNSAFVDITVANMGSVHPPFSQLMGAPYEHVLFQNLRLPDQQLLIRDSNGAHRLAGKCVVFQNCELHPTTYTQYVVGTPPDGFKFIDCYKLD